MFSLIFNPLKTEQRQFTPRRVLLIRGSHHDLSFDCCVARLLTSSPSLDTADTLSPLCSLHLSNLSYLLSPANWVSISHTPSTARRARLSSSVRERNWRWLCYWNAPWILSDKEEWQHTTSIQRKTKKMWHNRDHTYCLLYGLRKKE